jgi:hypothetical protein
VQYIAPSFPNHPQNKRETQNKKQNRKDIEDHSRPRCNVFEPFVSFDQSYHLAPLHSIKRMYKVAPVEHGKQTFHRSLRVPAVFPQDAPSVLNGANDGILIGTIHDGTPTPRNRDSRWRENFRSPLALRFYVSEAIAISRAFWPQPRWTY